MKRTLRIPRWWSELTGRIDWVIVLLEGQDPSADRTAARTRAALGIIAGGIFLIFAMVKLDDEAKVPLFTLVAATTLCINFIPISPTRVRLPALRYIVLVFSGLSGILAAYYGLLSVGPLEPYIWVLSVILIVVALAGVLYNQK